MEQGISRNQILSALMRSPHGSLKDYVPIGTKAAIQEPEFFSRLICYDRVKGEIRDSKAALPVIALSVPGLHEDFRENALAHLALLSPRELLKALRFAKEIKIGCDRPIRRLIKRYLRSKESNWVKWERMAVQHRDSLRSLYAIWHVKPGTEIMNACLYGRDFAKNRMEPPVMSTFGIIRRLKDMTPVEAAGSIMERRIPFLIAMGALGPKAKEPDLVLALIDRMSPAELMNNSKMLEKLGVKTVPALRAAYDQALLKAAGSKKVSSFKASVAAEAVEDEVIKAKLRDVQEKRVQQMGPDGDWAVLADKSGSMSHAIEIARLVASTLASVAKGRVYLVFFDTHPTIIDATGKSYEDVTKATKYVMAGGGTSIGCAVLALAEKKVDVDGIAIVSDGGENTAPMFVPTYKAYAQALGKDLPVYLYRTDGEPDALSANMKRESLDIQKFDLSKGGTDHYALAGLVNSMRVSRYSLADEIMQYELLRLDEVLKPLEDKIHASA